jgi:hypothetical protein
MIVCMILIHMGIVQIIWVGGKNLIKKVLIFENGRKLPFFFSLIKLT